MKKVKVQYVVGTEVREAEIENVHHWTSTNSTKMTESPLQIYADENGNELIAEFANVVAVIVAVMRVDGK